MSEILLTILGLASMGAVVFSYRMGLRDGKALREGEPLPKVVERTKAATPTIEEEKAMKLVQNVERYNGSAEGQEVI